MKRFSLVSILITSISFVLSAQNEVVLHLSPRLGNASLALDMPFDHPSGSYQVKFTRFEYYISEIEITHDGGQITPVQGMHLIVRPALDSMYSLGQMPGVTNVEAVAFAVGVESASNHLDPASFPWNDPLAPQNPSMHWGWSAGYRFAAIEGEAGTNLGQHFEIHALGDANYKAQSISTTAEQVSPEQKVIHLIADYSQVVKNITLSSGLIVHGSSGMAVTLLNNFRNVVFTAETSSGLIDPAFEGTFSVAPNPASLAREVLLSYSLPEGNDYQLCVTDLTGKTIAYYSLFSGENQLLSLDKMPNSGVYLVHLFQNNRPVVVEKLIVLN
ncbi:MAG: MbnP family protein [Saprospiraceae bacterium]